MRTSRFARTALAAVVTVTVVAVGAAEAVAPALDASVSSGPFAVGDRVTVHVSARGSDDALWGDLTVRVDDGGPWAVLDGPTEVVGARPPAWQLVLAPLALGEQALPTMSTTVREAGGEPRTVEVVDPPQITVASVLPPDGEAEPAPLRDPVGARRPVWESVFLGLVVLMAAAVVRRWIRRPRGGDGAATASGLPPRDELAAALRELREAIGTDPHEVTCDRLARALRTYLERRSGAPAREMTSFELRVLARSRTWPDGLQRDLGASLSLVDMVRFSRRAVDPAALVSAVDATESVADTLEEWISRQEAADGSADVAREVAS